MELAFLFLRLLALGLSSCLCLFSQSSRPTRMGPSRVSVHLRSRIALPVSPFFLSSAPLSADFLKRRRALPRKSCSFSTFSAREEERTTGSSSTVHVRKMTHTSPFFRQTLSTHRRSSLPLSFPFSSSSSLPGCGDPACCSCPPSGGFSSPLLSRENQFHEPYSAPTRFLSSAPSPSSSLLLSRQRRANAERRNLPFFPPLSNHVVFSFPSPPPPAFPSPSTPALSPLLSLSSSSFSSSSSSFFPWSSPTSAASPSQATGDDESHRGVRTPEGEKERVLESLGRVSEENPPVDMAYAIVRSRLENPSQDFSLCVFHGLLGSKRNMRSFSSLLDSSQIITLDLRNHGESGWRSSMRLSDLSDDIFHFLRQHENLFLSSSSPDAPQTSPSASLRTSSSSSTLPGEKKSCSSSSSASVEEKVENKERKGIVLVGHSLGGLAVMHAALQSMKKHRHPLPPSLSIEGLVVLDIAPVTYSSYLSSRGRGEEEKEEDPGRQASSDDSANKEGEENKTRQRRKLSTSEIVSLLADLPMSAFTDKNQLKRTLKSTDPPLSDSLVNWLLTAVKEKKQEAQDEDGRILDHRAYIANRLRHQRKAGDEDQEGTAAWLYERKRGQTNSEKDKKKQKEKTSVRLEWEMNIYTIHRMLRTRQLHWDWKEEEEEETEARREETEEEEEEKETNSRKKKKKSRTVFDLPVLFLKGSHSDYIREDRGDWNQILKLFPKAELKVVQSAGHWLHAEKPQETAGYINEFLRRLK